MRQKHGESAVAALTSARASAIYFHWCAPQSPRVAVVKLPQQRRSFPDSTAARANSNDDGSAGFPPTPCREAAPPYHPGAQTPARPKPARVYNE